MNALDATAYLYDDGGMRPVAEPVKFQLTVNGGPALVGRIPFVVTRFVRTYDLVLAVWVDGANMQWWQTMAGLSPSTNLRKGGHYVVGVKFMLTGLAVVESITTMTGLIPRESD